MNKLNKKSIVITSISTPTEAIKAFANLEGYDLVVVGDRKTPPNWQHPNIHFISYQDQLKMNDEFINLLPSNHYSRKMVGYLYAIEKGAEIIIDTDDDNFPKANFGLPDFEGDFFVSEAKRNYVNVYSAYTNKKIWPRGFPLKKINFNDTRIIWKNLQKQNVKIGIWQGLVDKDPDVDAIFRLIDGDNCYFDERPPLVINGGSICPFNSQNTAFRKELFPLLYLPATVSFRFTDILRGLIAQPLMWESGYKLGFTNATAFQERNLHDYLIDFESEIPMYLNSEMVVETAFKKISSTESMENNLFNIYKGLYENSIVLEEELNLLECWFQALTKVKNK